jgi:D-sedoheptulose 7-phosphate isomerase
MENHLDYITNYFSNSLDVKRKLMLDQELLTIISQVSDVLIGAFRKNNKVLLAGNGGSAGDAQHIAAEFVSRFFFDRPGLPAIALTTDTSMVTAIANDYGYENLFSRQVQAQSSPGDVFIGISTSGNSANVIKAMHEAKSLGVITVALCGEGGELPIIADYAIKVPSSSTPNIQECHICIGHVICAIVEKTIFDSV